MTTPRFEHFLAQLYVDDTVRRRFLSDARASATAAGLDPAEVEALAAMDLAGLELASRSYEIKRRGQARGGSWLAALLRVLRLRR